MLICHGNSEQRRSCNMLDMTLSQAIATMMTRTSACTCLATGFFTDFGVFFLEVTTASLPQSSSSDTTLQVEAHKQISARVGERMYLRQVRESIHLSCCRGHFIQLLATRCCCKMLLWCCVGEHRAAQSCVKLTAQWQQREDVLPGMP